MERELRADSWRPGRYVEIEVTDPKRRLVSAAPFRDRVVHHAVHAVVAPLFERGFIDYSYANRTGKRTHRAVRQYERFRDRHRHVLRGDVYRYFPAIDPRDPEGRPPAPDRLPANARGVRPDHRRLEPAGAGPSVLPRRQPVHAVRAPARVADREPDEPALRERLPRPIRSLVTEVLRAPYLRYVDDFALFANDPAQLEAWRRRAVAYLAGRRLSLHPGKTRIVQRSEPAEFLGYVLLPGGRRRLPETNVRRFRNRLRGLRDRWRAGSVLRAEVEQRVGAWISARGARRHVAAAPLDLPGRVVRAVRAAGPGGLTGPLSACGPWRFLEQQPAEPAVGQSQQERCREPERQQRFSRGEHAPRREPAGSWPRRARTGASRTGHDEPGPSVFRGGSTAGARPGPPEGDGGRLPFGWADGSW